MSCCTHACCYPCKATKTCWHCGQGNLRWCSCGPPWKLVNPDGSLHRCHHPRFGAISCQYDIVTAPSQYDLVIKVNQRMEMGFRPAGPVSINGSTLKRLLWTQPMVRDES